MNNQLIEAVIKSNNESCPKFIFDNPLLDRNVANAVANSFVKILSVSKQNSPVNNNMRMSILEKIQKMCTVEPENHIKVDDRLTANLCELYKKNIEDSCEMKIGSSSDKELDAFLMKRMKHLDMRSKFESKVNPEILQALINLNDKGLYLNILSKDIIHWNNDDRKLLVILQDFWNNTDDKLQGDLLNDISIKMKPEIERLLLEICLSILTNPNITIDDIFSSNNSFINLVKNSSVSADSFQISSSVLNFVFIMTNFDLQIQNFIETFVKHVKMNSTDLTFPMLYPMHVNHIVLLLDFDVEILPLDLKCKYIDTTVKYLHTLQSESEYEVVLLLSHFPIWFDIYFNQK